VSIHPDASLERRGSTCGEARHIPRYAVTACRSALAVSHVLIGHFLLSAPRGIVLVRLRCHPAPNRCNQRIIMIRSPIYFLSFSFCVCVCEWLPAQFTIHTFLSQVDVEVLYREAKRLLVHLHAASRPSAASLLFWGFFPVCTRPLFLDIFIDISLYLCRETFSARSSTREVGDDAACRCESAGDHLPPRYLHDFNWSV